MLIIPFYGNSHEKEETKLEPKQVVQDLKEQKKLMDETFAVAKEGISILSSEISTYGIKETIKINSNLFVPAFIFLIFFLLYLRGRIQKK